MRPSGILVVLACLAAAGSRMPARAESVPSFSLDYATRHATHVVVVDRDGAVVESWRGDLAAGDRLPFPANAKPLAVTNPAPEHLPGSDIAEVTGDRRVLFLRRAQATEPWMPVGALKSDIQFATVWIEKRHCFAIYQFHNPGDGARMHPLSLDEPHLKQEVQAGETKAKGLGFAGIPRAEKLEGDPLGFFGARRPFASWAAATRDTRLVGPVSSVCPWEDVRSFEVICATLHIRGPGDVEGAIKQVLAGADFVDAVPEGLVLQPDNEDRSLSLQAILKFKDGTSALVSVTNRWTVIEHRRRMGLLTWLRPVRRASDQPVGKTAR